MQPSCGGASFTLDKVARRKRLILTPSGTTNKLGIQMVDMNATLQSFQGALDQGAISPIRGELDRHLYVLQDEAGGSMRITYVYIANRRVTALACFGECAPINGKPCFQIGYAVAETHRGQSLARRITTAAMAEFHHGLSRNGVSTFVIEAAIDAENEASLHVARSVISESCEDATDENTGHAIKLFYKTYCDAG